METIFAATRRRAASAGQVWGPRPMPALSGLLFVWDDVVWAWADKRICGYFLNVCSVYAHVLIYAHTNSRSHGQKST